MMAKKIVKKNQSIFAENIDSAQIIKHVHNKRVQALWMQKHVFKMFACVLLIEFIYCLLGMFYSSWLLLIYSIRMV